MLIIKNYVDSLAECGFWKNNIIRLGLQFETLSMERNEDCLDCIESEEESIIEKILFK